MRQRLLVAGSNSGYQLGLGHDRDARVLEQAIALHPAATPRTTSCPFPPANWTVERLSSGSNHTLALLAPIGAKSDEKQLWATGTGAQGQLGSVVAASGEPLRSFQLFDWKAALASDGFDKARLDADAYELKDIVCGWNVSYLVLQPRSTSLAGNDILISLGSARDNTFGELGATDAKSASSVHTCAHETSFEKAIGEAGLTLDTPRRVTSLASGLRHAIAEIWVGPDCQGKTTSLIVGWGSARHGQIGSVPSPSIASALTKTRPGTAAAIVYEPQCMLKVDRGDTYQVPALIEAGKAHSIVLIRCSDGQQALHAFGSDRQGQFAVTRRFCDSPPSAKDIIGVTCNWTSTQIHVRESGSSFSHIIGSGSNSRGQLGAVSGSSDGLARVKLDEVALVSTRGPDHHGDAYAGRILKFASGSEHTLLLLERSSNHEVALFSREVWGYGWNEHGNLAQGPEDESDRGLPVPIMHKQYAQTVLTHLDGIEPVDVWAGFGTTFILFNEKL